MHEFYQTLRTPNTRRTPMHRVVPAIRRRLVRFACMLKPFRVVALVGLISLWSVAAKAGAQEEPRESTPRDAATVGDWVTADVKAPRVSFHTFESAAAKGPVSYHLYTPEAYEKEPDRRFPVVYWLHGSGGGAAGIRPLAERFDGAISAGKTPPFLVVFVNGLRNGMYVDWKDGSMPVETVIIRDLLPHIDATHRTVPKREARLLDGFSMGGYGAARLGFTHTDLFRTVSIVGGGPLQPDLNETPRASAQGREAILRRVYGGDQEYFRKVSPWQIAQENAAKIAEGTLIRHVVGDRDETFEANRNFHEHLDRLKIPHTWTVVPGVGHDTQRVFSALGDDNWAFYRAAFGGIAPDSPPEKAGFKAAADYSAEHSGRAVLILRDGEVVFERYDHGWSAAMPHPLASGTKSFTGVMAMMAVQDGLLTLDELASDTITEWKEDERASKITIRHLLTLSSGLPAGDRELSGNRSGARLLGEGAAQRARRLGMDEDGPRPTNLNERAIALESESDPGTRFRYGPSHFYAFSEVLQRKLAKSDLPQKTTMDYLRERVLEPIGIDVARIGRDRAGNPNLPGGMLLTAREWSKFGQFVLDGGSVTLPGGATANLLKPELLAQCFIPSANNPSYGLTWWLRTADPEADTGLLGRARRQAAQNKAMLGPDGEPLTIMMAAGLGKQRLYIIPQHGMVVVRFAEATSEGQRFDDGEFIGRILGTPK
jgi:CubicO group peptidase (beta-lactamase class C family)/enterochelin esterase-like enzyme